MYYQQTLHITDPERLEEIKDWFGNFGPEFIGLNIDQAEFGTVEVGLLMELSGWQEIRSWDDYSPERGVYLYYIRNNSINTDYQQTTVYAPVAKYHWAVRTGFSYLQHQLAQE